MKKSTAKFFKEVWAFLENKKTYIAVVVVALINLCKSQGWLTPETSDNLMVFFGAVGLAALRSAIK